MTRPYPYSSLVAALGFSLPLVASPRDAAAIRPFITDDARVVGVGLAQLETWVQVDETGFQHWLLPAFGPTNWLELSAGGFHGTVEEGSEQAYGIGGPVFQGKALLREAVDGGWPGLALAAGTLLARDHRSFEPSQAAWFGYGGTTASLFQEALLIHANVGLAYAGANDKVTFTAGVGSSARLTERWQAMAEVVRGDAYAGTEDGAVQGGLRFVFSESFQMDATLGGGIWGADRRPLWATLGMRLVTNRLW